MKLRPWLKLSLALNALLLGAVTWLALGRSQPKLRETVSRSVTNHVSRVRHKSALPTLAAPVTPAVVEVNEPFSWAQIESSDYHAYIANLRGIGCPEQTVRDLVVTDVDELFAGRVRELVDRVTGKFWELLSRPDNFENVVEEKRKELDKMKEERGALLTALFGDENPHAEEERQIADEARRETWAQLGDFLPEEKRGRFITACEELESARSKIWQPPGLSHADALAKQKELQDNHERALQAWLTLEEREELRLRRADTAQLRSRLNGLDVTDDEVRTLAKLQLQHQDAPMREVLGPERFAAFERAGDNRFLPIHKVARRVGLPEEAAVQVFDMRKTAEAQAQRVREDKSLADEQRQAVLRAIGEETRRDLAGAFGGEAFAAYERLDGGWLKQLTASQR